MEGVSELVRLGRLVSLPAPTSAVGPMPAEGVTPQAREQVVENLLADAPAAPRRQLEAFPVARQVAGFLQATGQVVERLQVADGVLVDEVLELGPIDVR